ncbi:sigma-E factor negative regulatory protein [Pseudothauera rhizosphaerae]|uniref:Anti-sigma 24 factor n=1 Tax=Pseudothauera rhizosphaerae TaxID=2565932 RepID=A0A4S4AMT3_9RHOO|nr:sigma-E factor negative regulatory protein [Pseudothauera rhizosphaerae]THF60885.1 anti-sigma 24 factor [Pseudothauera rhizosphaerae]
MKDKLSDLLDGSLDERTMATVFDSLKRDPSAREDWHTWCLIGDVLRGEEGGSSGFVARVMAQIEREPVVFAPAPAAASAAKRSLWQSIMPIAASVMGVAAVGWVAHTLSSQDATRVEMAAAAVTQGVERTAVVDLHPAQAAAPADPHREYVFVHQAMNGGPLPAAVQYVRTVSELQRETGR